MRDWINQATEEDLRELDALIDAGPLDTPKDEDRFILRTLGQVAAFLGVQLQTVKEWRTGPHPMPGAEGRWPIDEIVRWRIAKLQYTSREPQAKSALENENLEISNARQLLKLRTEAGELVSRSAAKAAIAQLFHRLRSQLEPLPDLLATTVPTAHRGDFLIDANHRMKLFLTELANFRLEEPAPTAPPAPNA